MHLHNTQRSTITRKSQINSKTNIQTSLKKTAPLFNLRRSTQNICGVIT